MRRMKCIVITGGIASGKSTVVQLLQELGGEDMCVFDSDRVVAELLDGGTLSAALAETFGAEVVDADGKVNKAFLRGIVAHDEEGRAKLNALIHPMVAERFRAAKIQANNSGKYHTLLADIPLYYETAESFRCDTVCTVATTEEQQIQRLATRNALPEEEARALIAAQLSTEEKMERADVVLRNTGSPELLRSQVELFYNAYLAEEVKAFRARNLVFNVNELRELPLNDLRKLAAEIPGKDLRDLTRAGLINALMHHYLAQGSKVIISGVLEYVPMGDFFLLKDPARSFKSGSDDVYVPTDLIKNFSLRAGNMLKVMLRRPSGIKKDRYLAAGRVLEIEGKPAEEFTQGKPFDTLTALIPTQRLLLENADIKDPSMRVLDLITPVGMGQRALIVAPPRGGKTVLLKNIARSIRANYPDAHLLILLLDERPEEVTDFAESVDAPVYASTFDESAKRHAQLSDLVLERAKRLVELGKDVIIMLDSLTRLSRGYNATQSGGRTMSGGLGSNALEKPRRFFGAARKVEEGGSLTIIATCLVETESRMDEIIFEEFKGTGNMEIRLDRELSERRIYPAISIPLSGTRNDDRLYHPDEYTRILQLRRQLASLPGWEGLETLLANIARTQNNAELLLKGLTIH